jgi:hypothetical protein
MAWAIVPAVLSKPALSRISARRRAIGAPIRTPTIRIAATVSQCPTLEQGTATISGQLACGTYQRVATKTASGKREVFLPDQFVTILKDRRVKALAKGLHAPGQLVFSTKSGAPLSHRNVAREITAPRAPG